MVSVTASGIGFDDIEFWVGEGANESAVVVDWNDGRSPESMVWGYRWDGVATGEDMFKAVVQADDRLFAHVSPSGQFGVSAYGIGYDLDDDGFGTTAAVTFVDGLSIGNAVDATDPTDPDDHWSAGFFSNGFWAYYLGGTGTSPVWTSANFGMSSDTLTDGRWAAFSITDTSFNAIDPGEPQPAPIPEPATAGLLLALMTGGMARRRRLA